MKTIFTLFTFIVFAHFGFSQPVISNVIPNFGDQMVYYQTDSIPGPGASGANVIWDFSDFAVDEYGANYTVNHPNDVDGSDQFPDATMVWTIDIGFGVLNSFMSFENNQFASYGSVAALSGATSGTILDDADVLYPYPINYQDTGSDTYSGIVHAAGYENPLTGESTYVVDGYGTVITPYGIYENVLRITTSKVQVLTTVGMEMIANITETIWFSPDYPVPVYLMSSTIDTYMGVALDSSFAATALVNYTGATGIDKIDSNVKVDIYPNPTTDYIIIKSDFQGVALLSIFSIDGKMVAQKSVHNTDRVDLSQLQAGYYLARLSFDDKPFANTAFVIK